MQDGSQIREFIGVTGTFVLTSLGLGKLGAILLGPDRLAHLWTSYAFLAAVLVAGWCAAYCIKRALFKNSR